MSADELALMAAMETPVVPSDAVDEAAMLAAIADGDSDADSGAAAKKQKKADKQAKKEKKQAKKDTKKKSKKSRDDDDESEAESDDDDVPRRKKHRKSAGAKFIDDAAGSSEDDDDDDGDSMAPGRNEPEDDQEQLERIKNYRQQRGIFGGEDDQEKTAEELDAEIKARYQARRQREKRGTAGAPDVGEGEFAATRLSAAERFSGSYLPRPSDPKVFAVKVRPGTARIVVARITNKCAAYLAGRNQQGVRQDLGIMSAFSVDHVKEWIYVESHRARFVDLALAGLEHVFRYRITLVDPRELMQLMARQLVKPGAALCVGQLARMKSGHYRNDLCSIVALTDGGARATVKLIPREDFVGRNHHKVTFRKGMAQRAKLFFVAGQAANAVTDASGSSRWGELAFDADGYVLREINVRSLAVGKKFAAPLLAELAEFFKNKHDDIDRAAQALGSVRAKPEFQLGEMVRIAAGQLRGVVGRIQDVSRAGKTVTISAQAHDGAMSSLTVDVADTVKFFNDGAHIGVNRGEHSNKCGTVVHTNQDANFVVFVCDLTHEHLEALCDDCIISSLTVVGLQALGGNELFDLVALTDGTTVGCIAHMHGHTVTIVKPDGAVARVDVSNIRTTMRGKTRTTDKYKNEIKARDAVIVERSADVAVQYHDQRAEIKHVFNDVVFAVTAHIREHAGLFAVDARNVRQIGGADKLQAATANKEGQRHIEKNAHPAQEVFMSEIQTVRTEDTLGMTAEHHHDDEHDVSLADYE
jgi:transcription elongation factor SPT5